MNSDRIALGLAAFAALGLVGLGVYAFAPRSPAQLPMIDGRPNILLIDVDTFSWDHVSVLRNGVSITPNIDRLAERGVRYTQAFAHSGWTGPSIHALMTGALPVPTEADATSMQWRARGARDLPEILGYYGYESVAFWGMTVANAMGNTAHFGQSYTGQPRPSANGTPITDPPTEQVVGYLEGAHTKPFLAYVHEVDLDHANAFSTFPDGDPLADPSLWGRGGTYRQIYMLLSAQVGEAAAQAAIRTHYDNMVQMYDARIGMMLDALDRAGLRDSTVVVLTSDHGNDFFEHAVADHGQLHDAIIHVPLVVANPALDHAGSVVDTVVQNSDIAPTLLAAAGVPQDAMMTGRPLPLQTGEAEGGYAARPVFSMSDTCHVSWRQDGYKLILRDSGTPTRVWYTLDTTSPKALSLGTFVRDRGLSDLPLPNCTSVYVTPDGSPHTQTPADAVFLQLFDLKADPGEQDNVAVDHPDVVARLLKPMLTTLAERVAAGEGGVHEAMSDDQVAQLKAQGYWGFVHKDPAAAEP